MVKLDRDEIAAADWKDTDGLLESIGLILQDHGLRLVQHDCGDDNFWVTVTKMSDPIPTAEDVMRTMMDEDLVDTDHFGD